MRSISQPPCVYNIQAASFTVLVQNENRSIILLYFNITLNCLKHSPTAQTQYIKFAYGNYSMKPSLSSLRKVTFLEIFYFTSLINGIVKGFSSYSKMRMFLRMCQTIYLQARQITPQMNGDRIVLYWYHFFH